MKSTEKLKKNSKTLKRIIHYVKGSWRDTILTWAMVLIESVGEVLVAFFMKYLIDAVSNIDGSTATALNDVYRYSGIIACLALVAVGSGILAGYWSASAAAGFGRNLRAAMFYHIQDYAFQNIDKFSTSSIVTRTTTDVTNVQSAFLQAIRAVVRAPFLMTFALIMCFVTQWQLAWIFLIIIPVLLVGFIGIANLAHPIFVKIFDHYDEVNQVVEEDVDGIRVVKAFNREQQEKDKFAGLSDFINKNFVHAEFLLSFNNPMMTALIDLSIILISLFGAMLIVSSNGTTMTVGSLSTLITYVMMISMSLMLVSMVYVMLIISRNSAERIIEIIDEKPSLVSPENGIPVIPDGSVAFDHVDFAYNPNKNVLTDITLTIPSGATVGIIGSTGSSKTTLISLIARLYDPTAGKVMVGGNDVKSYDLTALRDTVAVVLQKNTLFTGTIRDNLKWGDPDATDAKIWKACDVAQASDFIRSFSQGLDTPIVEGGTNVSGGQKQRLCIARALLKDPKILILDDSTSACDTHTDALIRKALVSERKDITKFVIAQRVLSIKDCEIILVMNEGKIIASGTNDSLMTDCSLYKDLYTSQLGGGDFDASK